MTTPGGGAGGGGDLGTVRGKIEIDASGAKKGAEEAEKAVDGIGDATEKTNKKADGQAKKFLKGYSAVVVGGLALAVHSAMDFDQALANVAAAGGKDAANQMDQVRQKALQLGADTKFSATEAAAAMESLIKAGLSVNDVLNGAADAAVNLAAAEGIDIPQAAEIAATAMTAFNLKAGDMPGIANKISQAASATKMDVNDFSFAMNQAGAVSKLVGLSFDDMTLAITAMGKAGIIGSDAGTSLKTFLMNLQPTTKKQTNLMIDLGIVTKQGANHFFDATGKVKSMADIAEVLNKALKGMSAEQRTAALETMFGSDAIRAAAIISEQGAKGMNDLTKEMGNQLSVAEKAKIKQDTLSGAIEKMKGSIETAAIKMGGTFIPVIRKIAEFIEKLADKFGNLPKPVQETIGWIIAATAALAGIAFIAGPIVKAFSLIGTAFRALSLLFMTNPWILLVAAIIALVVIVVVNWDKIVDFLSMVWGFISDLAVTVWNAIWKFITDTWTAISDRTVAIWNTVWGFLTGIWQSITDGITTAWNAVWKFFTDLWTNISDGVTSAWNNVWKFFTDLWAKIRDGVVSAWNGILDFFGDLPGNILDALGDFGELLLSVGDDLIMGLWHGIQNAADWLWDQVRSLGRSIADAFKSALGISSPSKVTAEIGQWITLGLGEGMLSKISDLKSAVNSVGSVIAPSLAPVGAAASPLGSAVLDPGARTGASSITNQGGSTTFVIQKLEIPINTNLDPTNALQWRQAMVAIKDGLAQVEREYS